MLRALVQRRARVLGDDNEAEVMPRKDVSIVAEGH